MSAGAIHVVPNDSFEDWIVRDDKGTVFGHYATEDTAELIAAAIARRCGDDLVIHLPDGRTKSKSFARGWFANWFSR
jgi:hypothetical protein